MPTEIFPRSPEPRWSGPRHSPYIPAGEIGVDTADLRPARRSVAWIKRDSPPDDTTNDTSNQSTSRSSQYISVKQSTRSALWSTHSTEAPSSNDVDERVALLVRSGYAETPSREDASCGNPRTASLSQEEEKKLQVSIYGHGQYVRHLRACISDAERRRRLVSSGRSFVRSLKGARPASMPSKPAPATAAEQRHNKRRMGLTKTPHEAPVSRPSIYIPPLNMDRLRRPNEITDISEEHAVLRAFTAREDAQRPRFTAPRPVHTARRAPMGDAGSYAGDTIWRSANPKVTNAFHNEQGAIDELEVRSASCSAGARRQDVTAALLADEERRAVPRCAVVRRPHEQDRLSRFIHTPKLVEYVHR